MKARNPGKSAIREKPAFHRGPAMQEQPEQQVYANRILEEWRANVQLYIHHDNLKQERIRHFLTMQGALLAFVGLSTKQAIDGMQSMMSPITFLLFSVSISVIGILLAFAWKGMDERARKFTLFERRCLRDLENQWSALLPNDRRGLSTYTALAVVLEKKGDKFQSIASERSTAIKQAYLGDYKDLEDQSGTASGRERLIFRAILIFWIASTAGHIALLAIFLQRHFVIRPG
jgi:hypothetical protein